MSFGDYLFWLLIEPLKILFEFLFYHSYKITGSCGWSIVVMSLAVNILLLPLYFRAEKIEQIQRLKKERMEPWIKRINAAFKGDERFMMVQAFYKENEYRSTDVFKESVSLFLQIPFFIAAYSFLSKLNILEGVSLGPIENLGAPDNLLPFGNTSVNLLPILMTVINIVSGFLYSRKGAVKDKIKLILIALVFLVLLYGSPSGLVFYWTLNNLFSLGKNIVVTIRGRYSEERKAHASYKVDGNAVILSCAVMTILTGLLIPSDVIVQNPEELINTFIGDPHTPLTYLICSFLIAFGTFMIWIPLFLFLLKDRFGRLISFAVPAAAILGIVNYIPFNKNFGLLSNKLIYDYKMEYPSLDIISNLMTDLLVIAIVILLILRYGKFLKPVLSVALIVVLSLSVYNTYVSGKTLSEKNTFDLFSSDDISVPMTSTGRNVVVIMMDRMIGAYIPYMFNERPQLYDQFDGFTFYPNTVSFGGHTNIGSPALFGGYEYTPERLNARSDELLGDKHDEALRVLPTIFSQEGWEVSVGDPPYAGYQWIPDLRIYEDNENINAYLLAGSYNDRSELLSSAGEELEVRLNRNLFCYSLMKTLPYAVQPLIYTDGDYNYLNYNYGGFANGARTDGHIQIGVNETFVRSLAVLDSLSEIVSITSDEQDCFFMFANEASHEGCCLQEPDYVPAAYVDNTEYDATHEDRFTVNGVTMNMDPAYPSYLMYEVNMASCIRLGNWFDYLRENGVYDNTRIIIVADHGMSMGQFDDFMIPELGIDAEGFNPVLLVKDFGSTGFTTSNEFMTNADTPFLALDGVVENPVNPFTGNPIVEADKTGEQLIYVSDIMNISENHGYQFEDPNGFWVTVRDDISDRNNWAAAD